MDPLNPFDEQGIQRVLDGIKQADISIQACDKAKLAGIDMSGVREQATKHRDSLLAIQRTYFPHRSA